MNREEILNQLSRNQNVAMEVADDSLAQILVHVLETVREKMDAPTGIGEDTGEMLMIVPELSDEETDDITLHIFPAARTRAVGVDPEKKYAFTGETQKLKNGITVQRIIAVRDFGNIIAGTVGGWIQSEDNLDTNGNAWVADDAVVIGGAYVTGNAWICNNASVYGSALIFGNCVVSGNASVGGNTYLMGKSCVSGDAEVYGNAIITDCAHVGAHASVYENAVISCFAHIAGQARVHGKAHIGHGNYIDGRIEIH